MSITLHVVAAVIRGADGGILLALRPRHLHQGGLWEFPGGKLSTGETPRAALRRELEEELGIRAANAAPLIQILHRYPDREVFLDVFEVTRWAGEPHGREGQEVRWVAPDSLDDYAFPAANLPIVRAAQLPRAVLVTPEPAAVDEFLAMLDSALARGIGLVILRAKTLAPSAYLELAAAARECCVRRGAKLLLNAPVEMLANVDADGLHLPSHVLMATRERPIDAARLLSAACHDEVELAQARRLGCAFALLSPVAATPTHPDARPLGWTRAAKWVRAATLPVYALGGMQRADLAIAVGAGCQGIAAIRSVWTSGDWRAETLRKELSEDY
ncbi:MAG: Nudix family hydrolase [Gammaproteobacteria bacterium]|nr:Nudix family hydrolase [Gammaproteobacteria bacterium]MBI5618523.1 Nudix family hydrolase [Gammaproteobacteria bacterium]